MSNSDPDASGALRRPRRIRARLQGIGKQPELLAAAALACVYFAVMSGHSYSIDGMLMYRQAVTIVDLHSLLFGAPIWWGQSFSTSKYGLGLSLLYVPGVAAMGSLLHVPASQIGQYSWDLFYSDFLYAAVGAPVHVVIGASSGYLVARLVRDLGFDTRSALLALVAYGVASPAIVYARGDFSQPLLGLCLIAGLLAATRFRNSGGAPALVGCCFSLVYAVLTRPAEGSFLLPALALLISTAPPLAGIPRKRYRALAAIAGSYLGALAITGAVNWARSGTLLITGYGGSWSTPLWIGLPGVLVSPGRSMILAFPLVLLLPRGLQILYRTEHRALVAAIAGLVTVLVLNNALWSPWWGSWSWGSRLLIPALPVLTVPAAIGARSLSGTWRVWLPVVLLLAGILWAVPAVLTDLLAGYAGTYDGSSQSFALSSYPPIGAWRFIHHLRPLDWSDNTGIDILWFRLARATGNLSLLVPLALAALAGALARRAVSLTRHESATGSTAPKLEPPSP